jgi:hypothetical protein
MIYKYKSVRKLEYWIERGKTEEEVKLLSLSRTPGKFEYFKIFKNQSDEEALKNSMNMVRKYGEVDGNLRFDKYRER